MSIKHVSTYARLRAVIVTIAMAVLVGLAQPPATARAALAAPQDLTPDSVAVDDIPVLSWSRVTGATSYTVELSTSSGFDTILWSTSTTNHQAVPTKQLPATTVYWHVRATNGAATGPWSTASLDRNALAGPTQISPEDGTLLAQPQEPVLLTWTAVTGAKEYVVEVSKDSTFADQGLKTTYTQKTTSLVVPNPQVAQTYYWHVRATYDSGIYSQWSDTSTYEVGGLAKPVLTSPADGPFSNVVDVVLDWEPVLGAKSYNLQVSTNQNFSTKAADVTGITGTRYSPPDTLANDQYYWRVQPVDAQGNTLDWSTVDIWTFRRYWPDQPRPTFPADDATIGDPPTFEWSPVAWASTYTLQISVSPTFDALNTKTVNLTTVHTSYVPTTGGWLPTAASGGSYYWRVFATDSPNKTKVNTDVIMAEVRHFTYDPTRVALTSPADGATVEVPTMTWEPVPGAQSYLVSVTPVGAGSSIGQFETWTTSFTPRDDLLPGTYHWQVRPKSASGTIGTGTLVADQQTFTLVAQTAPTGSKPEPVGVDDRGARSPSLTWTPVTDANLYKVLVRPEGGLTWTYLPETFFYPAGEDAKKTFTSPGTYQWRVEAYQGSNLLGSSTSFSTYTVAGLTPVSGQHLTLTGSTADDPNVSCDTTLPERCMDLRQTPVFSWDPVEDAGSYRIWLSNDAELTKVVTGYPKTTDFNRFLPTDALPDGQAGSAYYWLVQACSSTTTACTTLTHATNAFNKLTKPVQLVSPADDSVVANEVTFTWRDYLETNQDPTAFPSVEPTGINDVDPTTEAVQYRIQVSSDANFDTVLTDKTVDQMTFTSYDATYPEGPIYWRVQALDNNKSPDNRLTWSSVGHLVKSSPTVTLTEPLSGAQVSGSVPLRWEPLPYAASYDVEVYANNDTTGSSANKVDSGNVLQPAVSWIKPMSVSSANYTWRVRPVDVKGRKGSWTDLADPAAKFYVVGDTPVLTAPGPAELVSANDALFTWQPASGATTYKYERRMVGAARMAETVTTPALGWAPKSELGDGEWEWRVSSVDAGGAIIGSTSWRGFVVDGTAPEVDAWSPQGTVKRNANFVVTFSEPVQGVTSKTFRLRIKGGTTNLLAKVTLNKAGTKATLNPTVNLKSKKSYTLSLTTDITDVAGNPLTEAFSWKVVGK
ncbi:MAG: Ig-like domain-containing protein [Nocardioidaceae bacterium]|mgnify:CR=1 FL=1